MHLRELKKRKFYLKEYTNLKKKKNKKQAIATTKKKPSSFPKNSRPKPQEDQSCWICSFTLCLHSFSEALFLSIVQVLTFLLWLVCSPHLLIIHEALNASLRCHQQPKLLFLTLRIPNKSNFPNSPLWDLRKSWVHSQAKIGQNIYKEVWDHLVLKSQQNL